MAFRTWSDTRYARAARLGALRAWRMHLQVQNATEAAAPVTIGTWSDTAIVSRAGKAPSAAQILLDRAANRGLWFDPSHPVSEPVVNDVRDPDVAGA